MPKHTDDTYKEVYPPYQAPPKPSTSPFVPAPQPVVVPVVPVVTHGEPVKTGGTYTVFPDKAHDAAVQASVVRKNDPPREAHYSFVSLAQDIANLTAGGPGKVSQVLLDALHAKAQSILARG